MKALAVSLSVALLACAAAWNAGELHRQNCERAGRVACSVLPWNSGRLTERQRLAKKYGLDGWGP